MKNKHGLSRDIPEGVKRLVRQDCGFACVICGSLGMHYDHFDPDFEDCTVHSSEGIALLCPTCHQDKTSGRLSAERVSVGRAKARQLWKDPALRCQFSGKSVRLKMGNNLLEGPSAGFGFGKFCVLRIDSSGNDIEPWTLTGVLTYGTASVAMFQKNNVMICSGNWDVKLEGTSLSFRSGPGNIALVLGLHPNELSVDRIDFRWPSGFTLSIDTEGTIELDNMRHTGNGNKGYRWSFKRNTIVARKQSGPSRGLQLIGGAGEGLTISDLVIEDNVIIQNSGIADFNTLINVNNFLSEDMLSTGT